MSAKVCASCHREIYDEWKASFMAKAFTDRLFQDQLKDSRDKKECIKCHAPLARYSPDLKTEGVTCDYCHSIASVEVGERGAEPELRETGIMGIKEPPIPHRGDSKVLKSSEFCATCHHYAHSGTFIETTYIDWKDSSYARRGIRCQDCHMPLVGGRRNHSFKGGHYEDMLRCVATIDTFLAVENKGFRLTVVVTNHRVGHSLPGGTLGRQVWLRIYGSGYGGKRLIAERLYGKVFDVKGRVVDTTLKPEERRQEVFYIDRDGLDSIEITLDYYLAPEETQRYYNWQLPVVNIKRLTLPLDGNE